MGVWDSLVVEINMSQGGFGSLEFLHAMHLMYFYLNRRKIHSWMQR